MLVYRRVIDTMEQHATVAHWEVADHWEDQKLPRGTDPKFSSFTHVCMYTYIYTYVYYLYICHMYFFKRLQTTTTITKKLVVGWKMCSSISIHPSLSLPTGIWLSRASDCWIPGAWAPRPMVPMSWRFHMKNWGISPTKMVQQRRNLGHCNHLGQLWLCNGYNDYNIPIIMVYSTLW